MISIVLPDIERLSEWAQQSGDTSALSAFGIQAAQLGGGDKKGNNQVDVNNLIGNKEFLNKLAANDYIDDKFGLPTVTDIISELDKPGRDPRPEFS